MLFLRRLLRLPTPVDLGWSESNALGMREFTPYQEGHTWEDWRGHCRAHYPVRYFLSEIFPLWFSARFVWPLRRLRDWVLDYTVASRRHHKLDLRGIDPLMSEYRHGYLDPCTVFWLAGWHALMRWSREYRNNPREWMSPEEQAAPENQGFLQSYDELKELVAYWTVERLARDAHSHGCYEAMKEIEPTAENREAYEAASTKWLQARRAQEAREEEMWMRLCAMRAHLWD